MNKGNIGWFYYKEYFRQADFSGLLENPQKAGIFPQGENRNAQLLDMGFSPVPRIGKQKQSIFAKVCYPGLVTGVGIGHEAKIEGEFKLGMHFDYTYGMPVIYGSSVKGLLRSMFKYPEYIKEKIKELSEEEIRELEKNIFDGVGPNGLLSIYKRDIFYDAVIVEANKQGCILEQDALTPHGKDPLKNPQPLMFLKIASGVTMEFRFDLKDFGSRITAKQKLRLFEEILGDVGIGAKTNVGYGQLEILKQNS